ncbi:MAG: CHRD domain-containing protein [Candidatus Pacebacteria bacterium]|nr:CHRD domain-containing protein [Candidatus Paceibacterota bacterium]
MDTPLKRTRAKVITSVAVASLLLGASTVAFADTSYSNSNSSGEENSSTTGKIFDAELLGSSEIPAVSTSTTSRYAGVWFGTNGQDMNYWLDVNNGDEVEAAHLHCAAPGNNGPVVVELYESSDGTDINGRLAEGDITNNDIADTGSECSGTIGYDIENLDDLAQAIEEGKIYANVHSEQYPNGVARGQLAFRENTTDDNNGTSTDDNDSYNDDEDTDHNHTGWMNNDDKDWNKGDWKHMNWYYNSNWSNNDIDEDRDSDNDRSHNKKNWNNNDQDNGKDWNDDYGSDEMSWGERNRDDSQDTEDEDNNWSHTSDSHPIRTITDNVKVRVFGGR